MNRANPRTTGAFARFRAIGRGYRAGLAIGGELAGRAISAQAMFVIFPISICRGLWRIGARDRTTPQSA